MNTNIVAAVGLSLAISTTPLTATPQTAPLNVGTSYSITKESLIKGHTEVEDIIIEKNNEETKEINNPTESEATENTTKEDAKNVQVDVQATTEDIQVDNAESEVNTKMKESEDPDLYWLARLIHAEAGADWCSDELQLAVGSVVLNRVNSDIYPDSIKKVIFQRKQYGCINNKMIYKTPSKRAMQNAQYLLNNGSILPENVLGQWNKVTLSGHYKTIQGVVFSYL